MKIRPATKSDLQDIAAINIESWKDVYMDAMPAKFMTQQIERTLAQHWSDIDIRNEDIVSVAEEDSLVGFVAVWCRPIPFIDNLHVKPSHRSKFVRLVQQKDRRNPYLRGILILIKKIYMARLTDH